MFAKHLAYTSLKKVDDQHFLRNIKAKYFLNPKPTTRLKQGEAYSTTLLKYDTDEIDATITAFERRHTENLL